MLHSPTWLLAMWACGICYFDARYRRIPNAVLLPALVLACVVLAWRGTSVTGAHWSSALMAAGIGAAFTLPGYVMRKLGAGDVKYLFVIGLLTSWPVTLHCFLIAALLAGALALTWIFLPALAACLPRRWITPAKLLDRWLHIPIKERRMAFGSLLTVGLLGGLWLETHA
jgi:prepilin peptidase CpaA